MINIRINEMSSSASVSGVWHVGNTYILEDGTPLYPPLVKGRTITKVNLAGFRSRCETEEVKASIKAWNEAGLLHATALVQLEMCGYWWADPLTEDTHYQEADEKLWVAALKPPLEPIDYDDDYDPEAGAWAEGDD